MTASPFENIGIRQGVVFFCMNLMLNASYVFEGLLDGVILPSKSPYAIYENIFVIYIITFIYNYVNNIAYSPKK
jgi:hypothetical protein